MWKNQYTILVYYDKEIRNCEADDVGVMNKVELWMLILFRDVERVKKKFRQIDEIWSLECPRKSWNRYNIRLCMAVNETRCVKTALCFYTVFPSLARLWNIVHCDSLYTKNYLRKYIFFTDNSSIYSTRSLILTFSTFGKICIRKVYKKVFMLFK